MMKRADLNGAPSVGPYEVSSKGKRFNIGAGVHTRP